MTTHTVNSFYLIFHYFVDYEILFTRDSDNLMKKQIAALNHTKMANDYDQ